MITARPGKARLGVTINPPTAAEMKSVWAFADASERRVSFWNRVLYDSLRTKKKVVLWGSGSKAVSFLSSLGSAATPIVQYVVDINPFRHGCYMPGTGQQIIAPTFLADYKPDVVIAMNSIYIPEIESDLRRIGIHAAVLPIEEADLVPAAA
jgi:hypothetical protein